MRKNSALNKHVREAAFFKRRVFIAMIVIVLLSLLLISRLVYLQLIQHQFFSTLSRQNLLNIIPLKPSRGLIYDRNGVLLAKNIPSYSLAIIPKKVPNLPETILKLKKIVSITDDDVEQFKRYSRQYRPFNPVPLKLKLSEKEIARFYVNQQFFPGVVIQARSMRYYPLGTTCSEIVGYVGRINQQELRSINTNNYDASDDIGKDGVEKYYENTLHGIVGTEEVEIDAVGHIVRSLRRTPPTAGKNIYLTIDSTLQKEAHAALGEEDGAIVMIKPESGEILALVSHPSFDANIFAKGITQTEYQTLIASPDHPLFNRAIRGQYPPGSTVKPFIGISSLDNGIITPTTRIFDLGWFRLPNTTHIYHDWKKGGHGWVNISRAIEVSCDTFFYNLAAHLGITDLKAMLTEFGFGSKTKIDLPGEEAGLVPSPEWKRQAHNSPWYTGDTIETVFGQGYMLSTPLQLATAVSTIANRGIQLQPHVLLRTVDEEGTQFIQQPIEIGSVNIVHPSSWQIGINAMANVISGREGTAHAFGQYSFTAAGKTGTVQMYHHIYSNGNREMNEMKLPKKLRNHHLFIAFAPIEHPEVAIAVIVEHSNNPDKIAGQLVNFYFKHSHENVQN